MQPDAVALARLPAPDDDADLEACARRLAAGSLSFSLASRLLPRRLRGPAAAFYALCRVADDLVDDGDATHGLAVLRRRVDAIFAGRPWSDPIDRAFAAVVQRLDVPRAAIDALLEGFAWDADGRRYRSLPDVHAYAVRVAASVGVVMTVLMGRRDAATLARACDLGVAMQLTNIARDVAEDARRGRVYLPADWLDGTPGRDGDPATVRRAVLRLLDEAERLYQRAASGIDGLPRDCRPAIRAAWAIYRDIGRVIRRQRGDAIGRRARVGGLRKAWLLLAAVLPRRRRPTVATDDAPLPAARALVATVAVHGGVSP